MIFMKRSTKELVFLICILSIPVIFIYLLSIFLGILSPIFPLSIFAGYIIGFILTILLKRIKFGKMTENEKENEFVRESHIHKARIVIGWAFLLLFLGIFLGPALISYFGSQPIFPIISFGMIGVALSLVCLGGLIAEMGKSNSTLFNNYRAYLGLMIGIFSCGISILILTLYLSLLVPSIDIAIGLIYVASIFFSWNIQIFYTRKYYKSKVR